MAARCGRGPATCRIAKAPSSTIRNCATSLMRRWTAHPRLTNAFIGAAIRSRTSASCRRSTSTRCWDGAMRAVRLLPALAASELADAVFGASDLDFPAWHGTRAPAGAEPLSGALAWLRDADVPLLEVVLDPILGKPGLRQLFVD